MCKEPSLKEKVSGRIFTSNENSFKSRGTEVILSRQRFTRYVSPFRNGSLGMNSSVFEFLMLTEPGQLGDSRSISERGVSVLSA